MDANHPTKLASGQAVSEALKDKLLPVKLQFFNSIALHLEPFLTKYQTNWPVLPFMHADLEKLLRDLLEQFVKSDVLKEAKTSYKLVNIDIDKFENLLSAAKVSIGVSAKSDLERSDASDKDKLVFKNDCRKFMQSLAKKIIERSPLKYKLVKAIGCLAPARMYADSDKCKEEMKTCLSVLLDNHHVTKVRVERASHQFSSFLRDAKKYHKKELKDFDMKKNRLDHLLRDLMGSDGDYADIWECVKILLIFSHGNAFVESGFSINKDMLVENQREASLVALRRVHDYISYHGGNVLDAPIDDTMLTYARGSHSRYKTYLEQEREKEKEVKSLSKTQMEEKKRQREELTELQTKKKKLEEEMDKLNKEIIKKGKKK